MKNYAKQIANDVGVDAHIDPKSKKGITLIALVITIIVLLILAGVALSLVVGEDGITARAVKSRDVHNIAGIQEKANLAYHDSLIGGFVEDGVYHQVTLGDILSTLKTDGDIEDFGTTESSSITGISLGMDSLDLAVGGSQTLTVSSTAGDAGDYYVQYEGQKYLAHLENGNIVIDKDPMADGGSGFEISNVSSSNASVTAEKVGTNQVTVTGSSRGSSTVTVSYGSITATLNVTVKGNVTVSVSSEDTTKGTVTTLEQSIYLEGTKIALTATPATNYELDGWYIGTTKQTLDSEGKYTVPTDGTTSVALVAKFAEHVDVSTITTDITYEPSGTYDWLGKYATSYAETEEGEGDDKKTVIKNGSTDYTKIELATGTSAVTGKTNMSITKWKILKTNGDTVYLVPSSSANATTSLTLHGAQGYNNAVNLLDEACSALYGTASKGITAESIDMDLIEGLLQEVSTADSTNTKWVTAKNSYNHNNTSSYSHLDSNDQVKNAYSTGNSKYPVIYSQEVSGLGLSSKPASKIERSAGTSTTSYIGAITNATTGIKPYQTFYYMSNSDFSTALGSYSSLILPKGGSTNYWVASRCVNTYSSNCLFYVRYVDGGGLTSDFLFNSGLSGTYGGSRALFPVVSLAASLIKKDGSGNYYVDIN